MKKLVLLSSILLLTAVWAVAQAGNESNSSQSGSNMSQSSSDMSQTTIQGCLSGSDGSYTLTDKSGTAYQLTGDTAKLQDHVGHTIQVTGTSMSPSASNAGSNTSGGQSGSMSAPSEGQQTFNVTSFKHVSGSCSGMQ